MNVRERLRAVGGDKGFTLVEMLVSILLVGMLGAILSATIVAADRSATGSVADHNRTEEGRLAMNRVSRELRQAVSIERVVNPFGTAYDPAVITAVTFRADFNGDGCIDGVAPTPPPTPAITCLPDNPADPELISYCHEPVGLVAVPRLYVVGGALPLTITSCSGGLPILAERVSTFAIEYRSNEYRLDADGDGMTTWEELDAGVPPYGNQNGDIDMELDHISSVVVRMDLGDGAGRELRTQLALRNRT